MKFGVSTVDLRLALRAVAPHVDPDKDATQLRRLRVEVGGENVTVSATNGYTAALGLVSLWEHTDGEAGSFDLSPVNAKEILAVFKGKAGSEDEPGDQLLFEVTAKQITVTDISGLFPGKALTLPREPDEDNFPDVAALIAGMLRSGHRRKTDRLVASGQLLGLFGKAATAYGEPLVIDPAAEGATILVSCGESFIGLLMPLKLDEARTAQIHGWHTDWLLRVQDRAETLS